MSYQEKSSNNSNDNDNNQNNNNDNSNDNNQQNVNNNFNYGPSNYQYNSPNNSLNENLDQNESNSDRRNGPISNFSVDESISIESKTDAQKKNKLGAISINHLDEKRKNEFQLLIKKNQCRTFNFKFKNYHEVKKENGFIVFERNFTSNVDSSSNFSTQNPSNSGNIEQSDKNDSINSKSFSQNIHYSNIDNKNGLNRQYLVHLYKTKPNTFNKQLFIDQVNCYLKNQNIALAKFRGFSITDNNNNFLPTVLTERPVGGPLSSFFETIKENQTKCSSEGGNDNVNSTSRSNSVDINKIKSISSYQKFSLICGIANGIAYIHENNFVHFNLNPQTIYIDESMHPIICDYAFITPFQVTVEKEEFFNKYKFSCNTKLWPDVFQNSLYVAPEILSGEEFDKPVDVYSFGLIIFFIICEREPILSNGEINYPENFSNEWKNLINGCINPNSSDRLTICQIISELFDENKMKSFISSMSQDQNSEDNIKKIDYYMSILQDSIDEDFNCQNVKVEIFHKMIPNINDINEGVKMIISSAEKGDPQNLKLVGDFFKYGKNGILADSRCAFMCYSEAAELGNVDAMIQYAEFNETGTGIDSINYSTALKSYTKALELMDDDDARRDEIELKVKKLPELIERSKTITLTNVPLIATQNNIKKLFPSYNIKINELSVKEGESHKKVEVTFIDHLHFKNMVAKINRKNDYQINGEKIKFDIPNNKPIGKCQLNSLSTVVPKVDLDNYYCGKNNDDYIELGSGSNAITYLVYEKNTEKQFAAKVLNKITDEDMNFFKREIISASKFNHPAIVHYLGFSEFNLKKQHITSNTISPTFIMDFVPRGNLEKTICDKPEDWDDTSKLKVIIGIVSGMADLVKHNIVHRDLKPENILLNDELEPVICDFGCSRQYSNVEMMLMTALIGTKIFMAPELFVNTYNPMYKYEVDVYAFGIILYQIITSTPTKRVYNAKDTRTSQKLVNAKLNNYVGEIPDGTNPLIKKLIKLCWNVSFDKRPNPINIYKTLVDAVEKNDQLLPDANLEEVKEYINRLPKV